MTYSGMSYSGMTYLDDFWIILLDNIFGQYVWTIFRTISSSVVGLVWLTFFRGGGGGGLFQDNLFRQTTYSGTWGPLIPEFLLRNDLFGDDLFRDDLFGDGLFRDVLFGDELFTFLVKNDFSITGIMVFSIIWHCHIVFHCT